MWSITNQLARRVVRATRELGVCVCVCVKRMIVPPKLMDTRATYALWKEGPTLARLHVTPEHVRDVVQHKTTRVAIRARNKIVSCVTCMNVPPKHVRDVAKD